MFSKLQIFILTICILGGLVIFGILEYPRLPLYEQFVSYSYHSLLNSEKARNQESETMPSETSAPESKNLSPRKETKQEKQDNVAIDVVMNRLAGAFKTNDYSYIIDVMYTPVVRNFGGKEKAIADAKAVVDQMREQGMIVTSWKAIKPYTYCSGVSNRYAIIPYQMETEYNGRTIKQTGYQLGIKTPDAHWQFVNGDRLTPEIFSAFFPDFPTNVAFPELQQGYE